MSWIWKALLYLFITQEIAPEIERPALQKQFVRDMRLQMVFNEKIRGDITIAPNCVEIIKNTSYAI